MSQINAKEELIKTMYLTYAKPIFRYIDAAIGNKEVSEELTNDTFLVAYKKYDEFNVITNKKAWLYAVAKILIKNYFSHVKSKELKTIPIDESMVEMAIETEFLKDNIDAFKNFLQDEEINLLIYKYLIGYSNEEISKAMGISYTNCSTKLNRVRKKIEKNYFEL